MHLNLFYNIYLIIGNTDNGFAIGSYILEKSTDKIRTNYFISRQVSQAIVTVNDPQIDDSLGNIYFEYIRGITYTVNIDCFDVDATNRQAAYIYISNNIIIFIPKKSPCQLN